MNSSYDVVIAGGGPVGALLALCLAESPLTVLHADGDGPAADWPIALSHGSRLMLEPLGVYQRIPGTPIKTIHVSQRGGFGRTLIRASDYGVPALGLVAGYGAIRGAFASEPDSMRASDSGVTRLASRVCGWSAQAGSVRVEIEANNGTSRAIDTRLLVLADGSASMRSGGSLSEKPDAELQRHEKHRYSRQSGPVASRDYRQSAVVAQVRSETPHDNMAFERFTSEGPLALLPYQDGHALIWCVDSQATPGLCSLDEAEFLRRLGATFGGRLGRFTACGHRQAFPLNLRYLRKPLAERVITIGNAAQTLHPVAGQGLNLGLRDAFELATLIGRDGIALDRPGFAADFAKQRRPDRRAEILLTDTLVRVFSRQEAPLGALRGAALLALDTFAPARHLLARTMMYGRRSEASR